MRVLKWVGGLAALAAGGLAVLAYLNPVPLILMVASLKKPSVAPNHAVTWQQGPDKAVVPADQRPPNVLVILADDLGYNDITVHGGGVANGAVPTPNIDSIAKDGVELVNGYAGDATCAPSRAAIMTGRYATRFGFEFTPAPVSFARVITQMESQQNSLHPPVFHEDVLENIP